MMDLARTRVWARSLEQAQHPFVQVAHGAQHHHLGQQGDLCVPQPPRQAVRGLGRAPCTAHQCVFARTHTHTHTVCILPSKHIHMGCAAMHAQLCPTLCNPANYSPPGSLVHGIFRARTLKAPLNSKVNSKLRTTQVTYKPLNLLSCRGHPSLC